ncbi:hypothetical protein AB0N93_21355 [Streptomyces sp. NPDC091267]|uniref:hypothetical protein n=1 Tax=unclassified Streptomyces TaxID=2593676 RepID=UPI003419F67E
MSPYDRSPGEAVLGASTRTDSAARRGGSHRAGTETGVRIVVLTVDGERFTVTRRAGSPGVYDFDWDSGPNAGYGFTSAVQGGAPMARAGLEEAARGFLEQIDPATGYLAE